MSQLKQPAFLKKIERAIGIIPGLENQILSSRKKKHSANPLVFIDRKDEEHILINLLWHLKNDEKQAKKIDSLFHKNRLSSHSVLSFIYWRYTKRIYRMNNDIIRCVASTYVDNIPAQIFKELPVWSIYISAENLHNELPISYPINGFFFYPLINNDGDVVRLFIIDDLKQGQGISGLKEKKLMLSIISLK